MKERKSFENLFLEGEYNDLIESLKKRIGKNQSQLYKQLLLLEGRYNKYLDDRLEDILTAEQQRVESAIIRKGFLYIINQVFGGNEDPPPELILSPTLDKNRINKIVFLTIILFLGTGLWKKYSQQKISTFDLTIYGHGIKDLHDCSVSGEELTIYLNGNPRPANFDKHCRVIFVEIPNKFRDENIPISLSLNAKGYELVKPDSQYLIQDKPIYVQVKRDDSLGWVKGKITDAEGQTNIKDVMVEVEGRITKSDSLGNFYLFIPAYQQKERYDLIITKKDFQTERLAYYPNSGWITVSINKKETSSITN